METKETTMAHIIGENIRNLRKARRMTQHQLAAVKDIGISQPSLAAYETEAREPSARVINSLADYFGVTTDAIFGREAAEARCHSLEIEAELAAKIEQIAILTAECNLILNARKEHHHER